MTGDAPNSSSGRVEFFYEGVWGTVCHDRWGNNDATVVCRSQGHLRGEWHIVRDYISSLTS